MTNEQIMQGIWTATNPRELQLHLDAWQTAIDMNECSYGLADDLSFQAAVKEVIDNDFKRQLD